MGTPETLISDYKDESDQSQCLTDQRDAFNDPTDAPSVHERFISFFFLNCSFMCVLSQ